MCNALSTALYLCFVMIIDHSVPNSNTNDTLHSNCKHFLLLTTLILPTDYLHLTFHTTAKCIWSARLNKLAWIQVLSTVHIATIILPLPYCQLSILPNKNSLACLNFDPQQTIPHPFHLLSYWNQPWTLDKLFFFCPEIPDVLIPFLPSFVILSTTLLQRRMNSSSSSVCICSNLKM